MFKVQTLACLKIEGCLKGPEYIAVTTAAYRQALPSLRSFQTLIKTHIPMGGTLNLPCIDMK